MIYLREEIIDRFGKLPDAVRLLFGIRKIEAGPKGARLEFSKETSIDAAVLIRLMQRSPYKMKFTGEHKLQITWQAEAANERMQLLKKFVGDLQSGVVRE